MPRGWGLLAITHHLLVLWGIHINSPAIAVPLCADRPCPVSDLQSEAIATIWPAERARLMSEIQNTADPYAGSTIYNLQMGTATLLEHAIETKDTDVLSDLSDLYGAALDKYARQSNTYLFWEGYTILGAYNWVERETSRPVTVIEAPSDRTESLLHSSQFMFAVARLTAGAQDPQIDRRFARQIAGYYTRIILGVEADQLAGPLQRRGWGCFAGKTGAIERFNHLAFLKILMERAFKGPASYCNALTDTDTWILAGAAQLYALNKRAPDQTGLTQGEAQKLSDYLRLGAALLRDRTVAKPIKYQGGTLSGLTFDPGAYNDHTEMLWAGDEQQSPPWTRSDQKPPTRPADLSWDVSHGRRLVQLFESLFAIRDDAGLGFPAQSDMAALARQATIGIDRGSPGAPRFTNFLDGSNGWYRVAYSDRDKFGYPPFSQNAAWIASGYCRLGRFAIEAENTCSKVLEILLAQTEAAREIHETLYRPCGISQGAVTLCPPMTRPSASPQWLNFIVSF